MRIHAYRDPGGHRLAVQHTDDSPRSTPYRSLADLAAALDKGGLELGVDLDAGALLPSPVTSGASKMLFAGINYHDHILEVPGTSLPREPFFFAKLPITLCASGDPIRIPTSDIGCDYEVELAAVIGRTTRCVSKHDARDSILGFTVLNDVTAREIQLTANQLTLGKNLDGFCPTANVLVTPDEVDHTALALTSVVNGEVRQHATTADMIFSIEELISRLSALMTLLPGDVVSTGTPAGVGWFRNPRRPLAHGDVVTVEVGGIGRVQNTIEVCPG